MGRRDAAEDGTIDQAPVAGVEDRAERVVAQLPADLAGALGRGTAEAIAALVRDYPSLRDPILMLVHQQRGNGFAQSVLAAASTMHKQLLGPGEPAAEAHPAPAPAMATGPAPPDAATQKVLDRQKTAGWEQVARGGINDDRLAPSEIRLPGSVVSAIEKAWQDSLAQHPEREEGGNLVRTYGGAYQLRRTEGYKDDAFEPDPHDVGWTETMVGTVHTHPYRDEHEKNPDRMPTDYATVSAPDLDSVVNGDGPLFIVRSGPFTYVIAKSKQFNQLVERHEKDGTLGELVMEMEGLSNRIFDAAKGNMSDRLEHAIVAVCQAYHLVYYEGRGADLKRGGGPS